MIKLPDGVVRGEIPIDVRYRRNLRGLLSRINGLYTAIVERFGEEGLQLIRDVSTEYGRDIGLRVKERQGAMDIYQAGLFLVKVFDNMRSEGEVTEWNENRVAIAVPACPYPFTNPAICRAHTTMEETLVKTLNPALDYRIEKSIPDGDDVCLHVLCQR
ncbi:hypothetical protein ISS30_04400 [bacterium]|nr:hypothetical protein [bacterium]